MVATHKEPGPPRPESADAAAPAGPADELVLSIENTLEGYKQGLRRVSDRLAEWNIGKRARYVTELAFEEMLTNIIRYAYIEISPQTIDVTISRRGGDIVMVLEDAGAAFDPTSRRPPPSDASIETTAIGGRGLVMVRKLVHDWRYERRRDRNRLELIIRDEP